MACCLLAPLLASQARAGDAVFHRAPSLVSRGGVPVPGRSSSHASERRRAGRRRMEAFAAHQQLEARGNIRGTLRDAARRAEIRALTRSGDPGAVEHLERKSLAEEDLDELRNLQDWRALERWTGQPLGPVTFRVLQENAIRLHASGRRSEIFETTRELERQRDPGIPGLPELAPTRP